MTRPLAIALCLAACEPVTDTETIVVERGGCSVEIIASTYDDMVEIGMLRWLEQCAAAQEEKATCVPVTATDVDSGWCADGTEFRVGVVQGNEWWFNGYERHCGVIYREGKAAFQEALDTRQVSTERVHDARTAGGRGVVIVRVDGVNWAVEASERGFGEIVHRDEYSQRHGRCPERR